MFWFKRMDSSITEELAPIRYKRASIYLTKISHEGRQLHQIDLDISTVPFKLPLPRVSLGGGYFRIWQRARNHRSTRVRGWSAHRPRALSSTFGARVCSTRSAENERGSKKEDVDHFSPDRLAIADPGRRNLSLPVERTQCHRVRPIIILCDEK